MIDSGSPPLSRSTCFARSAHAPPSRSRWSFLPPVDDAIFGATVFQQHGARVLAHEAAARLIAERCPRSLGTARPRSATTSWPAPRPPPRPRVQGLPTARRRRAAASSSSTRVAPPHQAASPYGTPNRGSSSPADSRASSASPRPATAYCRMGPGAARLRAFPGPPNHPGIRVGRIPSGPSGSRRGLYRGSRTPARARPTPPARASSMRREASRSTHTAAGRFTTRSIRAMSTMPMSPASDTS